MTVSVYRVCREPQPVVTGKVSFYLIEITGILLETISCSFGLPRLQFRLTP